MILEIIPPKLPINKKNVHENDKFSIIQAEFFDVQHIHQKYPPPPPTRGGGY